MRVSVSEARKKPSLSLFSLHLLPFCMHARSKAFMKADLRADILWACMLETINTLGWFPFNLISCTLREENHDRMKEESARSKDQLEN